MFLRFVIVGALAFLVDWAALTLFLSIDLPFFISRALSFLCAATIAWILNRIWTFQSDSKSYFSQWFRYVAANMLGGSVNYFVSVLLSIIFADIVATYPVVAIAAGTLSGMLFNFFLSKRFVF